MTLRFPGDARPSTAPLRWQAWTGDTSVIRFPGEAAPATAALRWGTWTGGDRQLAAPTPTPARTAPAPTPAPVRAATPAAAPTPAPATRSAAPAQAPSGTPDGRLAAAMLANHQAVSRAHESFLEAQEAHLALTEAVHRRLAALAEVIAG